MRAIVLNAQIDLSLGHSIGCFVYCQVRDHYTKDRPRRGSIGRVVGSKHIAAMSSRIEYVDE